MKVWLPVMKAGTDSPSCVMMSGGVMPSSSHCLCISMTFLKATPPSENVGLFSSSNTGSPSEYQIAKMLHDKEAHSWLCAVRNGCLEMPFACGSLACSYISSHVVGGSSPALSRWSLL